MHFAHLRRPSWQLVTERSVFLVGLRRISCQGCPKSWGWRDPKLRSGNQTLQTGSYVVSASPRTSLLSEFCSSASWPTPKEVAGAAKAKSTASSRLDFPQPLGPEAQGLQERAGDWRGA